MANASEPDAGAPAPVASRTVSRADEPRGRRAIVLGVGAGLLASLLSWGAGEALVEWFHPKRAADASNPMAVQFEGTELDRTSVKNAALSYGVQGAILGALLGLAGGAAYRTSRGAVAAGLTGVVAGAALGAGGAFGAFTAFFQVLHGHDGDLLPSAIAHATTWAALGVASGLAFGIGSGDRRRVARTIVGGLVGGSLGALVYDVVGSIVFPLAKTGEPIAATAAARLLAHGLAALAVALGAVAFGQTDPRRSSGV